MSSPEEVARKAFGDSEYQRGLKDARKLIVLEELKTLLERLKVAEDVDKELLWEMVEDKIKEFEEGVSK